MPLREYVYTRRDGEVVTAERLIRGEPHRLLLIKDPTDGFHYQAVLLSVSLPAKQATNWSIGREGSDLPPEKAPYIP